MCLDTLDLREAIEQDIRSLINSSVLSALDTGPGLILPVTVVVMDGEGLWLRVHSSF
jgi:hypothetical protein